MRDKYHLRPCKHCGQQEIILHCPEDERRLLADGTIKACRGYEVPKQSWEEGRGWYPDPFTMTCDNQVVVKLGHFQLS